MTVNDKDTELMRPTIEYTSGKTLMEHGSEELHKHVSTRMEVAMGKPLPQMDVRFKNLKITADMLVSSDKTRTHELPTLTNTLRKGFRGLSAKKNKVTKTILHEIDGVFKPGTMTLVLGQPGSGKSSLLKVLSGRFPASKSVHIQGDITYNDVSDSALRSRLPQFVSYVTQRDNHFATLSVRETLEFAHECCGDELSPREEELLRHGTPEENQQAIEAARAFHKHSPDVVIQTLGLEKCQNTIVGDAMLRGVSGGERKRVTTGEMSFGNKFVLLMDEISTGLDSAATFDIIKSYRSLATNLRKTIVIALLQPSPEVFAFFDNVLLLNKGRVLYHGPREQVVAYFEGLGFHCPPRRDVADFLLDISTPQQQQYEVTRANGKPQPRKATEFAKEFASSPIHDAMLKEVHEPHDPALLRDNQIHFDSIPEFHQSFWASTMTLLARQFKVTVRNTAFLRSRVIMVIIMGLLYSSVFWQVDPKNPQVLIGVLFTAVLFLALGQATQLATHMSAREIFYKQRGANFYRSSSYVLAYVVNQIPYVFVESVAFGAMIYWMCGFVSNIGSFILFEVFLFVTDLTFASWFFFMAAIIPDIHIAKSLVSVSIVFFIVFSGFLITRTQVPDYFVWAYWLDPLAWAIRSLAIIEYRDARFDKCVYDGINYCKEYAEKMGIFSLGLFDIQTDKVWLWYSLIFLLASYVGFTALATITLEYKRYEDHGHASSSVEHDDHGVGDDRTSTPSESSSTSDYNLVKTPRAGKNTTTELALTVEPAHYERKFVPVTLAFSDIRYSVPNPTDPKQDLVLLKGISGFARPGTMTALMGSSGAGKTTLMDVIAGRKTEGKIEGHIYLNGYQATDLAIRRATGYCEQMDIHSEAATIREALTFSAFLRQSSDIPDSQKFDSVEECLDLLDLRPIADQITRGSSVEQMKRLTIGVELAAQPSVLFLDEPTSGLDARSAKVIMDGVRKVADSGRTVVCTIHQPSWEVFSVFDSLLLLKHGGQTVYFGDLGEKASKLVNYFESMPGVAPLDEGYNPAAWMLEVIGAGVGNTANQDIDFAAAFEASEKKSLMMDELLQDGMCHPVAGVSELSFTKKRAASEATQARLVIQRFRDLYWRTPSYNVTRVIANVVLALICGLSFLNGDYTSYQGINSGVGLITLGVIFISVVSLNSVLPIAAEERASFYRERASQTYNALWYFVGGTVAEIPYVITTSLLFSAIFFPMAGFTGVHRFFPFWGVVALHTLFQTYMGQLLAYVLPSIEVAAIIGTLVNSIFILFIGMNPPASEISQGYKWLYYITPPQYTVSILSALVFADCPEGASPDELSCKHLHNLPPTVPANLTIKEYVEHVFLTKHDEIGRNIGILVALIVFVRLLTLVSLRYVNHQKK
ncbi:hypothetical protein Poli38472_004476 [Pythium oligandrum]|uniref:ABC transporter domain-containing protein n=1 Tax=Pythium oligandrum TaxID=41045 RepID=A0A8K1CA69_PYTOL|nr:hypothetical protein Poli38472_004476 [Pythium oligandrum]|eukprot:TMW59407.1 hypothetical protein Poli38472_004476 [Pythium oligandrum]